MHVSNVILSTTLNSIHLNQQFSKPKQKSLQNQHTMAEHPQTRHRGDRAYRDVVASGQRDVTESIKGFLPENGPSASQVVALVTLFPIGGFLLLLAGLTLAGTLTGLAITTPLFVIFSPVLVPAALVIGLAVTGFLTSGAFGITGLSALSWIINNMRRLHGSLTEQVDYAKRRAQDTAGYVGQRTKDVGQNIQNRAGAHEGGRAQEGART